MVSLCTAAAEPVGSLMSHSLIPLLSRAGGSLQLVTNSQRGGNVLAHRAACGGNICASLTAASGAAETREDSQSAEQWDTNSISCTGSARMRSLTILGTSLFQIRKKKGQSKWSDSTSVPCSVTHWKESMSWAQPGTVTF